MLHATLPCNECSVPPCPAPRNKALTRAALPRRAMLRAPGYCTAPRRPALP
jgi:hypothetical protein